MKRKQFSEEQIIGILKEAQAGATGKVVERGMRSERRAAHLGGCTDRWCGTDHAAGRMKP